MATPYPHHPYSEIFPFREETLVALSDNMLANGQHDDIVLLDKQVIEGRHRQAAGIRAGMLDKLRYRDFGDRHGDGDDPLQFVFDVNFHRRDLSPGERKIAAVAFADLRKGYNSNGPDGPLGRSQQEASKKFGVPVRTLKKTKAVLEKGVPELIEAMKAGKVTVTDAASIVSETPEVQAKALADVLAGKAKTLRAAVAGTSAAPAWDGPRIARHLEQVQAPLAELATGQTQARELALTSLRALVALVGRL